MSLRKLTLTAALCLTLCLGGCSSKPLPSPTLEPEPGVLYYTVPNISRTGTPFTFDINGTSAPSGSDYQTINDIVTRKPAYIVESKQVSSGKTDNNGNIISTSTSILYDLEGGVLIPEAQVMYTNPFGDLIVSGSTYQPPSLREKQDNHTLQLINVKTGEVLFDGVCSITSLSDKGELFALNDCEGVVMGIIDSKGNKVSGFPAPEDFIYPSSMNLDDRFIVSFEAPNSRPVDRVDYVIDTNFNVLYSSDVISAEEFSMPDGYMFATERNPDTRKPASASVVRTSDFTTVMTAPTDYSIYYFDGDVAIMQTRSKQTQEFSAALYSADGTKLSSDYGAIALTKPYTDKLTAPVERFICLRQDEGLDIIDRTGKVVHSVDIPYVTSMEYLTPDLCAYWVSIPTDGSFASGYCGIVDSELNIVQPADKYDSIYIMTDYDKTLPVIVYSYEVNHVSRYALKDLEGNVIIEDISGSGTVTDNYIAVSKGNYYGLIDYKGNWVIKKSIYEGLSDM